MPVLFVCENNLYAMGMRLERAEAQPDIHEKAKGYLIPSEVVDGMDVVAVESAARRGAELIRAGNGPYFLECRTYRFRAHSMFDAQAYRPKDEIEAWKRKGPIVRFQGWLDEAGLLHADELERDRGRGCGRGGRRGRLRGGRQRWSRSRSSSASY